MIAIRLKVSQFYKPCVVVFVIHDIQYLYYLAIILMKSQQKQYVVYKLRHLYMLQFNVQIRYNIEMTFCLMEEIVRRFHKK